MEAFSFLAVFPVVVTVASAVVATISSVFSTVFVVAAVNMARISSATSMVSSKTISNPSLSAPIVTNSWIFLSGTSTASFTRFNALSSSSSSPPSSSSSSEAEKDSLMKLSAASILLSVNSAISWNILSTSILA